MIQIIKGGNSVDHRGEIRYVNDFDMLSIKRFYIIKNSSPEMLRGWRAHKIEQRWFYVLKGKFIIYLVKIDNWESPNSELDVDELILTSKENLVLHIPAGYGTAFKAVEEDSEILVFADYCLDHNKFDDYTFELDYFKKLKRFSGSELNNFT